MRFRSFSVVVASVVALLGCASTIGQDGLEQRTAQSIGRSVGQFTIGEQTQETGGRINYMVKTSDGAAYSCYLYGATAFQSVMSFGQTPHSDAICTAMVGVKPQASNQAPAAAANPSRSTGAECNALLRAAKRC